MAKIVDHWYWGRVYAEDFTLVYADVTARERYGSHASTPVMLARDGQIVLSTGEVAVETGPEVFNATADHAYPSRLTLRSGSQLELVLEVKDIIHSHNLLNDVPVVRSPLVKPLVNMLVGHPGYFRFRSDFTLSVELDGAREVRHGSTLHEMVALR
jgi:hypothetical protein